MDPLDGTTNFLHGMPHWAVSIALEFKGEIVSAVVFDPAKDELYIAEKGMGTFMNGTRLRVSNRNTMSECVFATGVPFGAKRTLPAMLHDLAQLMPACAGGPPLGALRRWTSPMSLRAATMVIGNANCSLGTLPPGCCWCARPVALPAPSARAKKIFDRGEVIAANSDIFDRFAKIIRSRPA